MGKMTVEQILAYLQKKSTTNGDSVFAHLAQLIQQIVYCQPESAIDMLETSLMLKLTRFFPEEAPKYPRTWKDTKEEKFIEEFISLQSVPDKKPPAAAPAEGEAPPAEEAAPEEFTEYTADNFLSDSNFFEAVGVGLGRSETYQVCLAFRALAATRKVSKAKFFGKFLGTDGNYYVFETVSEALPEPEAGGEEGAAAPKGPWGRPVETVPPEKGTGANALTYWVCSRPGAPFYRLPDVTPLQIKTARQVKKFFTGNLKAEVSAYPPFPGVEENYLRAQIARISATTEIAPKGFYKLPEEGAEGAPDILPAEEYAPLPQAEQANLENWSHKNRYLNLQGRTTLFVPEKPAGEEGGEEGAPKEETPPTPEQQEVIPEKLASIDADKGLPDGLKPWTVVMSSTHKSLKHQVLCLRSILWPGACTVTTPTGFTSIYIGWGIKNRPYVPPLPPPVLKEFEGLPLESRELPPIPKPPPPAAEGEAPA